MWSRKNGKKIPVKELKKGSIFLANGRKAKVTEIRTAEVKADLKGLDTSPVKDTLYRVQYKFADQDSFMDLTFESTYLSGDLVIHYPERKPTKYSLKVVLYAGMTGMLVGMALAGLLGLHLGGLI